MGQLIQGNPWVWIIVQDPGGNEQFLGQTDEQNSVSFIPVFLEKEAAGQCLPFLARMKDLKYEVQAILYEDLIEFVLEHHHLLFILNGAGKILEKINPEE
jgi:hypothetical protein